MPSLDVAVARTAPSVPRTATPWRRTRELCALVVAGLGAIVLASWYTRATPLKPRGDEPITIAPTSSLAFVLFGAALGMLTLEPRPRWVTWAVRSVVLLVALLIAISILSGPPGPASGADVGAERWFVIPRGVVLPIGPVGQLAFQTAAAFLMADAAFLLLSLAGGGRTAASAAGCLGTGVATLGLVFFLSYAYGAPFFTDQPVIPMAVHTTLAFVALGLGIMLTAGPGALPFRLLVGPSVQARLLRAFLPVTALIVAGISWLMHFVGGHYHASPAALISSTLAVASLAAVALLCMRLANRVGGDLEQAEEDLRQAERKSRGYADLLEVKNVALQKANDELYAANMLKEAFMRAASHELRTPVTILFGLTELAMSGPVSESSLREWFARVHESAERLNRLVDQLGKMLAAGRFDRPLELEPTDMALLLRGAAAAIQPFINQRHQQLLLDVPDNLGTRSIEAAMIRDVLEHLLLNAVKFTPDGGQVQLAAERHTDGSMIIRVKDTGIGITPEQQPHLFKTFFTGTDPSHHSSGRFEFGRKGLGLGLSLVKAFVEMHGGQVSVESAPGKGSTFTIRLPP